MRRILTAQCCLSLLVCAAPVRGAATLHVTTCANASVPPTPGSLRAAVAAAHAGDTVVFDLDCPDDNPIYFYSAAPLMPTVDLAIDGAGHRVTLYGGNRQPFDVQAPIALRLSHLALRDAGSFGGAAWAVRNRGGGTVVITDCAITATHGEGALGLWNEAGGTMVVERTTIAGSHGPVAKGINNAGTLVVIDSRIADTASAGYGLSNDGGGFVNEEGATATVTGTTFANNVPADIVNRGTLHYIPVPAAETPMPQARPATQGGQPLPPASGVSAPAPAPRTGLPRPAA